MFAIDGHNFRGKVSGTIGRLAITVAAMVGMYATAAQAQTPPAAPAINHAAAVEACKQHAANHDAHKKCMFEHHKKTAPAAHHAALEHAFAACHHLKDQAQHTACIDKLRHEHHVHTAKHGANVHPPLHHDAAHAACSAHASNHDAHKQCLAAHHKKTAHPSHHAAIDHAFKACHHIADHAKHAACLEEQRLAHHYHVAKHGAKAHPPLHHAAAHHACGAHASNHDAHKQCLLAHHKKTSNPALHAKLEAAFKACHAETDHAKHAACVDQKAHS